MRGHRACASFKSKRSTRLPLVSEDTRLLPCSWLPASGSPGWRREGSTIAPTPAHWQPRSATLISRPRVFVVIYTLLLSPKCQGQCLIHAAPPTPPGTQGRFNTHSAGLNRTSSPPGLEPECDRSRVVFTSFLSPTVPRIQLHRRQPATLPAPSSPQTSRQTPPLTPRTRSSRDLSFPSWKVARGVSGRQAPAQVGGKTCVLCPGNTKPHL